MNVVEDGRKAIEFSITDRDGSFKTLPVTPRNKADGIDSWLLLWQQQAGNRLGGLSPAKRSLFPSRDPADKVAQERINFFWSEDGDVIFRGHQ
jgi:hypothetical protein